MNITMPGKLFDIIGKEKYNLEKWGAVAPALDILICNEPLEKLFARGLVSGISNSVTTAIVGGLLCVAYAATRTKAGSLTKE